MAHLYIIFDRETGRTLGRGTWQAVRAAMRDARRAGYAVDIRRAIATPEREREALYCVTRDSVFGRRAN